MQSNSIDDTRESSPSSRSSRVSPKLLWFFGGIAVGSFAMLLFDPAHGNRRRSSIRDRGVRASRKTLGFGGKMGRDMRSRVEGLKHKVRSAYNSRRSGQMEIPRSEQMQTSSMEQMRSSDLDQTH